MAETQALSVQKVGIISAEEKAATWDQAGALIKAGLFPSKFKRAEEAFAAALYGRELGLTPQRAFKVIHLIQGMPCLEAHQQVTFAKLAIPGLVWGIIEHTDDICVIEHGLPGGKLYKTSFSWQEAKTMGAEGKDNWKKHRKDMLYARAATRAIKWYYPETQGGLVHSLEEMRDVIQDTHVRAAETGAPRAEKVSVTVIEAETSEAAPDVEAPAIEDPAAIEALKGQLALSTDKNAVDKNYGSWRSANAGKNVTLLHGYDLVSAKLFELANPKQ